MTEKTPDLPIPEAAREAALEAFNEHGVVSVRPSMEPPDTWVCRCGKEFPDGGKPGAGREQFRPHVLGVILAAALPHLRSLQVETQVREWIGRQQHKRGTTAAKWSAYMDVAAEIGRLQASRASQDGRTTPAGTPSHPQDSQSLCTCPPHIDGIGREKWPDCRVHTLRDIGKGDPNG